MKDKTNFFPKCNSTCIGSLPYLDAEQAVEAVFRLVKGVPFWPQLPKRDAKESMLEQFIKNFSFLETKSGSIVVKDNYAQVLESFLAAVIKKDLDYFEIGSEFASGFYAFKDFISKASPNIEFLKGQITGPFTLASSIKIAGANNLLSNKELLDALVCGLAMKAAWQVREFKRLKKRPVIFIDEPYLACFGSGFTPVNRQDVISVINRLIETIAEPDCLIGLHCCSNTDWSMCLETDIDIISFDAFSYMERFTLYPQELKRFLKRGGVIAWGIVPTQEFKPSLTITDLRAKFEQGVDSLVKKGLERKEILDKSLVTPSCGMGTLSIEDTEALLMLLAGFSKDLRNKFSFS